MFLFYIYIYSLFDSYIRIWRTSNLIFVIALLYLHRGYFVRALSEHQPPQNLLEGRYAPSVLAIFRTSCVIMAMLQALEKVNGELAKRFWLYWCHGLAAAVSKTYK